ncbi:hypothetical protein KGQ71_02045 [Patescibacteria group bacterium]|nr:hypothetical protein [Patescibacteria group bacterium]
MSRSIYFGIGLTGAKELSPGLPIDVLSLMMTAEYAKRRLHWTGKVFILLADTHAIAVGRSEKEVQQRTIQMENDLTEVCGNLGLNDFQVIKASELLMDEHYQELLRYHAGEHTYDRYQWADCAFLNLKKQVGLKISWSLGGPFKPGVRDERSFDIGFQERWTHLPLSYLYLQSGRTFDPACPRSAPYLMKKDQSRLMLTKESNAIVFLNSLDPALIQKMGGTTTYLWELTKLFERVIAPLPSECLGERLQGMLDLAFGRFLSG